ncbi:uncharacterized protein LOC107361805 [Tetranychus urticae]|uniref:F-box domain-containing protein n=1 Tax=Tetranychus urticae TaxID=32264 RepID=T1K8Q5_TETUR|nr:uncharacterized protein LOC107361805 [Tetranychus urticae]
MLINELPDDCLMAIFEYVNDLDDLINCYKVCVGWSYLIAERTKKAKYLLEDPWQTDDYEHDDEDDSDYSDLFRYPWDCVFYRGRNPIDVTCLNTLFPNLTILEFTYRLENKMKRSEIVSFVRNHESLKGIIDENGYPVSEYCNKLEMTSTYSDELSKIQNASNIKQLYTGNFSVEDVKKYAHDFPNLELLRTSINMKGKNKGSRVSVFEKLKILILYSDDQKGFHGFHLMDLCPNLQSAFITMECNRFFVDETVKHECLQDLVIQFFGDKRINWNDLERLLMKYPNLKHLALRKPRGMNDEHVEKLIQILPNLVLLNVENWPTITKRTVDIVDDYCKRNGRSIKCYVERNYNEIKSDWPHLSTTNEKISRGFDFMKHCFLKDSFELPHFLVPVDY